MSEGELVTALAARGDGMTEKGNFLAGAVPGDRLAPDGIIERGPHHIDPPCRHFGKCGGCQLQHVDDEVLADFVRDRVLTAARKQGVEPRKVAPTHLSPPHSRRRATLHAVNGGGRPRIGFREEKSHRIVDLRECHVLRPELFALVEPLRGLLTRRKGRYAIDIDLTLTDQGVDCGLTHFLPDGLEETEALLEFAREHALARLTFDNGYGPETQWEPEPVSVTLGGVAIPFPSGAFLQATEDGENALLHAARDWLGESSTIADLFAGLGTFAFGLAEGRKVLAVEAALDAHLACKAAAGRIGGTVHALHRDLFRNPLRAEELDKFDAVLLDPPRAGAKEQAAQIAQSSLCRVIYISCNPSSWARDAKPLCDAGFALEEVRPVGQFRWSTHVELASMFVR